MPWTAPQFPRKYAPYVAGERQTLDAWLDFHRATLLGKCSGLTSEQLKQRAAPPSNLSLLGLVRHMTEVERGWFRAYGNENWKFDADGYMEERHASINDVPIAQADRKFHWDRSGPRPAGHPGLSDLGL